MDYYTVRSISEKCLWLVCMKKVNSLYYLQTYMAHCIYLEDKEIDLLKHKQVGVAHCPNSNFR